jgi:hypothetical protein
MARLPAPEDYALSAPRPSRSVTDISPVRENPDLLTGRVMQDIGAMMQQEAEKLDDTVALDALNQLQSKQLDLTYGDNGFTKVVGGDVVKRPITTEYADKIKAETEALGAGIGGAAARAKFQQQAAAANRSFNQKLFVHAAKETETFHQQTFKGSIGNAVKAAEQGAFADGIGAVLPIIEAEVQRQGLAGEAADLLRREALGPVYSAGVKQLLTAGQSGAAKELLDNSKPYMTPAQVEQFSGMVKTQSDYDTAGQWVNEARAKNMKPAEAYDFFRQKGAGNKDAVETARGQFEHYVALNAKQEAEASAPMLLTFHGQGANFAAKAAVVKSPEFIGAKPEVQVKLLDYMEQHARSALSFGQSQQDRAERKKMEDPAVLIAFQNLADSPENLMAYSDAHLQGVYLPILGPQLTAKIVAYKKQVEKETTHFKIDQKLIDQALPTSLQQAKGDQEQGQKKRFNGLVTEGLIDWKMQNPGKLPSQEEQNRIIEQASRNVQQAGAIWGTNTIPAYQVKTVPEDFRKQARDAAAKSGKKISESRILELWALRKESR